MCSITCRRIALLLYARERRAHLANAYKHSIIHYHPACSISASACPAPRAYACKCSARGIARTHVMQHAAAHSAGLLSRMPAKSSGLSKIGLAGDPGILTLAKLCPPWRARGEQGRWALGSVGADIAQERWALGADFAWGHWALGADFARRLCPAGLSAP